eukprot:gene11478-12842_t
MRQTERNFGPVEGVRVIFTFWIVSLHVCGMVKWLFYAGNPPRPDSLIYLSTSTWSVFAQGQGVHVEVFFMLSGFLLTHNLLQKDKGYITEDSSPVCDLVMLLARRLLRLWPALLVAIGLTYYLGDYHDDWWTLVKTLTFPLNPHQPMAFVVNWSSRVDIQCSIVLFLVFYLLKRTKTLNFTSSCLITILSVIPKCYDFFFHRELVSYVSLKMTTDDNRYLPVSMHRDRQNYYISQGLQLSFVHDTSDLLRGVLTHDYLVYYKRITPFFIGMTLAIALRLQQQQEQQQSSPPSFPSPHAIQDEIHQAAAITTTTTTATDHHHHPSTPMLVWYSSLVSLWHSVCLFLSVVVVLSPAVLSLAINDKPALSLPPGQFPPFLLDFFFSVFYRSIYALGMAYCLYRCLLPPGHPLQLLTMSKLLSTTWPLKTVAVYSYAIYTIHMRVMMDVILKILPLSLLDTIFGREAVFVKFLSCM